MKKSILVFSISLLSQATFAQKMTTTSAVIIFDATTSTDALPKAENKAVIAAIDLKKGTISFEAGVKNFSFSNPMMQEHFNGEKWMNSDKFPKATFNGKIINTNKVDFTKPGKYEVDILGNLTIRDSSKSVKATSVITIDEKATTAIAAFKISLADFGITGAPIDAGKVSKEPTISVTAKF